MLPLHKMILPPPPIPKENHNEEKALINGDTLLSLEGETFHKFCPVYYM